MTSNRVACGSCNSEEASVNALLLPLSMSLRLLSPRSLWKVWRGLGNGVFGWGMPLSEMPPGNFWQSLAYFLLNPVLEKH
ncbi:hypothetical protein [Lusitaniella coriacea]|uniref:hypothetical protein n=1 Tax=Lusitaniella coriacea TaxID=1983105 RepID=UPI003CF8C48C